ncbi:MAG: uracil permease [Bacilli bacterium]|nr:uracil permease [Bacilli bacterium]
MNGKNSLVLDVEEVPSKVSHWIIFAIQHILAMLVACITVPLLTGLPVAATLVSAGIGTICYLLITKFKSPVFLSSSFAYLSPMFAALAVGEVYKVAGDPLSGTSVNYAAVMIGMIMVGAIYGIIALIIKFVGTKWINKVLPPIVVGPVIMVIGLGLAGSAINNLTNVAGDYQYVTALGEIATHTNYNLLHIVCGLVALFGTALASHYGKGKMPSLIPFVIGMGAGYVVATLITAIGYYGCGSAYCQIVNYGPFEAIFGKGNVGVASFFNYNMLVPNTSESFMFLRFEELKQFNWADIGQVALLFAPVALVTVCEHIGDHENLGNIIGRDLLNEEPGMARTLSGDGLATAVSGVLCGAANTTYGENVAVIGTTGIASVKVVFLAALMAIGVGFVTPFTALLSTIPGCVTGGVSLVLYGFIASSGVKMLIAEKVDFGKAKNIFVASAILVAGIGGLAFKFGDPLNPTIQITSVAVAMILGIVLNVCLREKKADSSTEDKAE